MQEFKVGDKVKRKESMWEGITSSVLEPFKELTVSQFFNHNPYPTVCFKETGGSQWDASYFELVDSVKKRRFAIGDKVISIKNTIEVAEGYIGFVKKYSNRLYMVESEGKSFHFYEDELELLTATKDSDVAEETLESKSALDKQVSGSHYKDCGIQPIEYIHANNLSYFQGNVIKYVTRYKDKAGKADLEKAIHYLELMIELEYKDK